MNRQKQISNFANNYAKSCYANDDYESYAAQEDIAHACIDAINWADEHPRKGLVDIDKVCEWLKDNLPNWVESYKEFKIIEDLCNAMMDENTPIIDEKKTMEELVELKNELLR